MKNYLILLGLLFGQLLSAQQPKPDAIMPQQQPEPSAPTILQKEAAQFLSDFQKAVSYLANKQIDSMTRVNYAIKFAGRFAPQAVIQVMNVNKKVISLRPLDYFQRLIALNYDEVNIDFSVLKSDPFSKTDDGWWRKPYLLKQTFKGKRGRKTVTAEYTIKSIDLYYYYDVANATWTKKYGHVLALDQQPLPRQ